ncbi:MAG: RDD family protein, partial [Acidimicrobiales bacterium]|nr:RDD family protein [Acidimicrobiales bacterium]
LILVWVILVAIFGETTSSSGDDGFSFSSEGSGPAAPLLILVFAVGVDVFLQGTTGASPGKHLMNLRVVKQSGEICGIPAAGIRWILKFIDWLPCIALVGIGMILGHPQSRRVGDLAAGTYVVPKTRVGIPIAEPLAYAPPTGEPMWPAPGGVPPRGQAQPPPPAWEQPPPPAWEQPPPPGWEQPPPPGWEQGPTGTGQRLPEHPLGGAAPPDPAADNYTLFPPPTASPSTPPPGWPNLETEPTPAPAPEPAPPEPAPAPEPEPATTEPAPTPAEGTEPMPEVTQSQQPPDSGPQWDPDRGTYVQWDPVLAAWMQWDEPNQKWIPVR